MLRIVVILSLLNSTVFCQVSRKEQRTIQSNLERHLQFLSSDGLQGRRAGTEGEKMAAAYISEEFRKNGLVHAGNLNGFMQPFSIVDGRKVGNSTYILINSDKKLDPGKDFFPYPSSPNVVVSPFKYSRSLREKGGMWSMDLSQLEEKNRDNPHFDITAATREEIDRFASLGAGCVLMYMGSPKGDEPVFDAKEKSTKHKIPVFYITRSAMNRHLSDTIEEYEMVLNFSIEDSVRTAYNVVGYIDNGRDKDIIIGAHYDHLGYGEDGNSMSRSKERDIHNGADDNASGTSALIELSRILSKGRDRTSNFLFIAFSAEEIGLNGSKFYVDHPALPISRAKFMINMDMVGRLNDSTKTVTISGYGTSPQWSNIIDTTTSKALRIKLDSSGTGPSDHTSFYRKDIPVLFFFTGLHSDYHKPSDDHDKINYTGLKDIVLYVKSVVDRSGTYARLDFLPTRERQTTTNTRFTVSLGIMPDYTYTGTGLRVDGVSEGRPAKTVGIRAGDVLIRLGDSEVSSVESYMRALSRYKKGDETTVEIQRSSERIAYKITFQ